MLLMMMIIEISKNVRTCQGRTKSLENEIMCVAAATKKEKRYEHLHKGGLCVGIDTLSSYCLTNNMADFKKDTIKLIHYSVTGIAGTNSSRDTG
jgi:hypothetical protein